MFGHGTFKPYVIMLSDRLVRTSRNGLSHKMEPLSLPSTSRGVPNARVMMNMLAGYNKFFLVLETEESISELESHHILQDASEL